MSGLRWAAPPEGVICINIDTALFPGERRMGCGAEALAVRRALTISKEHGVSRAVLVSDCLSLIQRIASRQPDRSTLGTIIADIKSLASDFESCTFKFTRRGLNVVAHKLLDLLSPWFLIFR
jgi:hypothetical protein